MAEAGLEKDHRPVLPVAHVGELWMGRLLCVPHSVTSAVHPLHRGKLFAVRGNHAALAVCS